MGEVGAPWPLVSRRERVRGPLGPERGGSGAPTV